MNVVSLIALAVASISLALAEGLTSTGEVKFAGVSSHLFTAVIICSYAVITYVLARREQWIALMMSIIFISLISALALEAMIFTYGRDIMKALPVYVPLAALFSLGAVGVLVVGLKSRPQNDPSDRCSRCFVAAFLISLAIYLWMQRWQGSDGSPFTVALVEEAVFLMSLPFLFASLGSIRRANGKVRAEPAK